MAHESPPQTPPFPSAGMHSAPPSASGQMTRLQELDMSHLTDNNALDQSYCVCSEIKRGCHAILVGQTGSNCRNIITGIIAEESLGYSYKTVIINYYKSVNYMTPFCCRTVSFSVAQSFHYQDQTRLFINSGKFPLQSYILSLRLKTLIIKQAVDLDRYDYIIWYILNILSGTIRIS